MMKMHPAQRKIIGPGRAGLLSAWVAVLVGSAPGATIRLQRTAAADETVTLADVAHLKGEAAKTLGQTTLKTFAEDQTTTKVKLQEVRHALNEQDVNWGRLSLTGFMQCVVTRQKADKPAQSSDKNDQPPQASEPTKKRAQPEVGSTANIQQPVETGQAATLRQRIKRLIHQMSEANADALKIDFSDRDQKYLARSVLGKRYELEPRAATALGRVPIAVRVYKGGRITERFTISATVKRQVKAVVASKTISRGDRFAPGSIERATVWLKRDTEPITDKTLVEGQRADAVLRKGQVIYPEDVEAPTLVKRGQLVTVRCLAGGLVVRTAARAQEDGTRNDLIKVRNESSRETFTCKVTGPRRAVVDLRDQDASTPTIAEVKGETQ